MNKAIYGFRKDDKIFVYTEKISEIDYWERVDQFTCKQSCCLLRFKNVSRITNRVLNKNLDILRHPLIPKSLIQKVLKFLGIENYGLSSEVLRR